MSPWTYPDATGWWDALCRTTWQGSLLILLVWLLVRLRPHMHPELCGWLWWLACARLVLGLAWHTAPALPILPAPDLRASRWDAAPAGPLAFRSSQLPAANTPLIGKLAPLPPSDGRASPLTPAGPTPQTRSVNLLFCLWTCGISVLALRTMRQVRQIQRLRQSAVPVSDPDARAMLEALCRDCGMRRPPRLLESPRVESPLAMGLLSPAILLPCGAIHRLSPAELRLVLAHEVGHLRRGDLWLALVPRAARLLFFFHPLAWLAAREWTLSREIACDTLALSLTGARPAEYGRMLLRFAAAGNPAQPLPGLGILGGYHRLKRRIEMLGQFRTGRPRPAAQVGIAVALGLAVVAALPWRVTAQDQEPTGSRATRLAEQWEDVLLLDATRYLRLSPDQLAQIAPLARTAADRLNRLAEENDRTLATVERIARKHREALLHGQRVSIVEQEGAVNYGRALQQKRAAAEEQLLQTLTPRLARILTRDQVQRAFLLALGDWPPNEAKSPALLDPASGFVVAPDQQPDWLEALRTANPDPVKEIAAGAPRTAETKYGFFDLSARKAQLERVQQKIDLDVSLTYGACDSCHRDANPKRLRLQAGASHPCPFSNVSADGTNRRLRDRLATGATDAEMALSLRPLARRLFFSPRFQPVLAERLGK